jgi:hypothetical protein
MGRVETSDMTTLHGKSISGKRVERNIDNCERKEGEKEFNGGHREGGGRINEREGLLGQWEGTRERENGTGKQVDSSMSGRERCVYKR